MQPLRIPPDSPFGSSQEIHGRWVISCWDPTKPLLDNDCRGRRQDRVDDRREWRLDVIRGPEDGVRGPVENGPTHRKGSKDDPQGNGQPVPQSCMMPGFKSSEMTCNPLGWEIVPGTPPNPFQTSWLFLLSSVTTQPSIASTAGFEPCSEPQVPSVMTSDMDPLVFPLLCCMLVSPNPGIYEAGRGTNELCCIADDCGVQAPCYQMHAVMSHERNAHQPAFFPAV